MAASKVYLVPWDAADPAHFERMQAQRVACGWRADEVGEWADKQAAGTKVMYWVVLSPTLPNHDELLAQHTAQYPSEATPIQDAKGATFIPVGQIGLEKMKDAHAARFDLDPATTVQMTSLYISWALQTAGLGRSAVVETERAARLAPHNADIVFLDTMAREFQLTDAYLAHHYDARGLERPPAGQSRTTQDWYARQGYELVAPKDPGPEDVFAWKEPASGKTIDVPIIYMKKDVTS